MALGPGLPIRMAWPSPFWRATSAVPMVPPAPDRFSTIAGLPHTACRCCARKRPITSVEPPVAAGTMMRTVSVGRHSAAARPRRGSADAADSTAAADSTRRRENPVVTVTLPALFLCFAGSVGSAAAVGKLTGWRRRQAPGLTPFPDANRYPPRIRRGADFRSKTFWLVEAEQLEQRGQVAEFLARGRRGAADEVEDLAVLQPVIGEPLHVPVLVEIDSDDALVDDLLVHEGDFALGALRDVIEHLAVEGGDRRGRAHHDQHLVLAGPDRDLLERAGGQDVALLELLAGAAGQRRADQCCGGDRAEAGPARGEASR